MASITTPKRKPSPLRKARPTAKTAKAEKAKAEGDAHYLKAQPGSPDRAEHRVTVKTDQLIQVLQLQGEYRARTHAYCDPECRATFVSDSCTTR